jgi:O-antigen/teichoic acid export membrane protein
MQARDMDRPEGDVATLGARVKTGVLWRSGSQIAGQVIAWGATFLVLRLLSPSDYGLVAMTGAVLAFLSLFHGWGFASALVRQERTDSHRIGQAFGLLILTNGALAAIQLAIGVAVQASFWDKMPVWYHLSFLALLAPGILLGARLARAKPR